MKNDGGGRGGGRAAGRLPDAPAAAVAGHRRPSGTPQILAAPETGHAKYSGFRGPSAVY